MQRRIREFRHTVLIVAVAAMYVAAAGDPYTQGAPVILKVEPPNWWAGHSINPVRLLVRGRNLSGAQVTSPSMQIQILKTRINDAGSYLFADVAVDPQTAAGSYPLIIRTAGGKTALPFELSAPLPAAGRFQGLSRDDVIYLIMPDRFANGDPANDDPTGSRGLWNRQKPRFYHGGDLQGIINHMPYLKDLGVTAIWLNPIYENVNQAQQPLHTGGSTFTDYHGYGAVDFYAVEEHFGDPAKLRELVDAAHRLGIKVIQDQVANHTGPGHPWVKDPPTPTWFHGSESRHMDETWQAWTLADPHATAQMQKSTLDGWFADILPDLNQDDEEVARYLIQNTLWWIGMAGFDAIREDTLPYVPRRYWRDWASAVKKQYPRVTIVGEVFNEDPALVSFFQGGEMRFDGIDSGVDSLFDFPSYYMIRRAFAQGRSIRDLAAMLGRDRLYVNPGVLVTFLGLHDVPRFMNETGSTPATLRLAFTFLMTARGIPMIYYGDEIGMPGGEDPDNRRDFPGGWPDDPRDAFTAAGRTPEEEAIFAYLRQLTRLRAELEPLRRGTMMNLMVSEQTWAFARIAAGTAVVTVFNNDSKPEKIAFSTAGTGLQDGTLLRDRLRPGAEVMVRGGMMEVSLPGRTASIYAIKKP